MLELYSLTNYEHLNENVIDISERVMSAKKGILYAIFQPDVSEDGKLPNPIIRCYSYK